MFTVEFEDDETSITIMDNTDQVEDVKVLLYEDYCHIAQWNERKQEFESVMLTSDMYLKLMAAWQSPEGTYVLKST